GLAGGVAGLVLACFGLKLLILISATSFPRTADARVDVPVFIFTALLSLATGVLFGVAPALHFTRGAAHDALREGSRGTAGARSQRVRSALVTAELALSLALLA